MLAEAAFIGDERGPNRKRAEPREGLKTLPYDYGETAKPVTM